ncbi:prolyl oligopeptidase family serine peptidase [Aquirhabdus parva]|uniref:prolyl oligopeptidase n=1 Tax=Aquirhabdus parva TaxID=2283318 RepID=A0A345P428_9GAMM|nr:prolyl oligopeptidase family serine peptidase [Aquirhabdus parva]AXI02037.1 S9 family peptidase [Aquirhabdus parva]
MSIRKALTLAILLVQSSAFAQQCNPAATKPAYPLSKKNNQVDDYHGTAVADPYRWLEDANSDDTKAWVAAQNQLTQSFLAKIPARAVIKERLTQLWNYEKFGTPFKEGGRYFYSRNDGLQNQSVLYTEDKLGVNPRVLLDPNTLATDGTVALAGLAVSPNGKYLAYGTAASGSDWNEWKVRDIDTGKDLSDDLQWVKFSGASWLHDSSGFFYSRYDKPTDKTKLADVNYYHKLYFHKLGTKQSEDVLVYERKDQKEWGFAGSVTDDGHYLIISVSQGTDSKNRLYYKDLTKKNAPVVKLLDDFDATYSFIDNVGSVFYINSNLSAPKGKILAIDVDAPAKDQWRVIVPEKIDTLENASIVGQRLILNYLKDAYSQVQVYSLDGKLLRELKLPGIGSVGGLGGHRDDKETFYSFTSFTTPTTIYRYDIASGDSTIYRQPKVNFDPKDFNIEQVFYTSKDGTKVPMFIVSKKGIKRDGTNPTYLYGYGGFDISLTPAFSPANLVWLEMGGVYAVPNLRGGGEYGQAWHLAGTKLHKQNVFDDFIAAAEYLIQHKYTSPQKLAIGGGSNGGLLVGATLTQRPELFAAALPSVGVMDMLRFQKFTIGWAWASDYGSSDNAEEFKALYAYSPLHNLKAGTCYPAVLVSTADHDDRVVPAHSFKFTATAQADQAGAAPILIRIDTKAGHGSGKPTTKQIEEVADKWGFLTNILQMDVPFNVQKKTDHE